METETIQTNVIADIHLPTEGEQSPSPKIAITFFPESRLMLKEDKLFLICSECGEEIEIYQANRGRLKQFCDRCIKKHRREKDKKYFKRTKYWTSGKNRKYRREKRWKEAEENGTKIEHRYEIDNCVVCGRNISMYISQSKYCMHCSKSIKKIHELGTCYSYPFIRRWYDHNSKKVIFDFEKEREDINKEMKKCGLKMNKNPMVIV